MQVADRTDVGLAHIFCRRRDDPGDESSLQVLRHRQTQQHARPEAQTSYRPWGQRERVAKVGRATEPAHAETCQSDGLAHQHRPRLFAVSFQNDQPAASL
ncbi:unnamed protein product [Protopolystoma xenopodis]|uniref:Uncharacterized protein n=1 Tax=Protopolystoma xenopodis TaxID=117903 RepID=A0A3S5CFJ4_9PLAT|nr:unnamed protein product [Protopolystoma xenopodis]